jgi:hypothetical protein
MYRAWIFDAALLVSFAVGGSTLLADTFTTLAPPSASQSRAYGISGSEVSGYYTDASGNTQGYIYNGSSYTTIDNSSAVNGTFLRGISGNLVAGYYTNNNGIYLADHGFIYNTTTSNYTPLNDPLSSINPQPGGSASYPTGIDGNNAVGYFIDNNGVDHGFLYNISNNSYIGMHIDPAAPGGVVPYGISGTNVVGYDSDANGAYNAFLYSTLTDTYSAINDPLANDNPNGGTTALGIDGNYIVGSYQSAAGKNNGFVYDILTNTYVTVDYPNGVSPFNTFITGISGDTVVGYYSKGGKYSSFEATLSSEISVVPLPSSAWGGLALIGGCGLLRFIRRKTSRRISTMEIRGPAGFQLYSIAFKIDLKPSPR